MSSIVIYLLGWLLIVTPLDYLIASGTGSLFLEVWAWGTITYFVTCAILLSLRS